MEPWHELLELTPTWAIKIGTAFVAGLMLGIERERKDKPAGLRTIVLITIGAAIYMIVGEFIVRVTEGPQSTTRADPTRVASQVVTGIGFLGAGTIIQSRESVHGLTTAATIWVAAGIGVLSGAGFPILALMSAVTVVLVLVALDPFRDWLSQRGEWGEFEVLVSDDSLTLGRFRHALEHHDAREGESRSEDGERRVLVSYSKSGASSRRLLEALARIDGIRGVPGVPGARTD